MSWFKFLFFSLEFIVNDSKLQLNQIVSIFFFFFFFITEYKRTNYNYSMSVLLHDFNASLLQGYCHEKNFLTFISPLNIL